VNFGPNSSPVASGDDNVESNQRFWQGQDLFFKDASEANNVYELYEVVDGERSSDTFVRQLTLNADGERVIDTDNLEGEYVLVDPSDNNVVFGNADGVRTGTTGTVGDASFTVTPQTFDIAFGAESVFNSGDSTTTTFNVESNRGSYVHNVTATLDGAELSAQETITLFPNLAIGDTVGGVTISAEDPDDDGTDEVLQLPGSDQQSLTVDADGAAAGTYEVSVSPSDTAVSDTASLTVNEPAEGQATFQNDIVEVDRGDVAAINVNISGAANTAQLTIGNETEFGYEANLNLTDGNGDGEVTVLMNTFAAGLSSTDPFSLGYSESDAFRAADRGDGVTIDQSSATTTDDLSRVLDATTYDLSVSVEQSETDVGTLSVTSPSLSNIAIWTAPGAVFGNAETLADVQSAVEAGAITQQSTIAAGDVLIHDVDAAGVYGAVDLLLQTGTASNAVEALDTLNSSGAISLTFEQTAATTDPNTDPNTFGIEDVNNDAINVIANDSANKLFVNVDTAEVGNNVGVGDEYQVNLSLNPATTLVRDNVTVSNQFSVVDRTAEFDLPESGVLEVEAAQGQTISGETTVAPGTELDIRLRRS
jgi:hypothetical protein